MISISGKMLSTLNEVVDQGPIRSDETEFRKADEDILVGNGSCGSKMKQKYVKHI